MPLTKYILRVLALTLIVGVILSVSFGINRWINQKLPYRLPQGTTTLIIGDSQAMYGIDPAFIPNSENVSNKGELMACTYLKLKAVLPVSPQVNKVVLNVNYAVMRNWEALAAKQKQMHLSINRYGAIIPFSTRETFSLSYTEYYHLWFSNCVTPNADAYGNLWRHWQGKNERHFAYIGHFTPIKKDITKINPQILKKAVKLYQDPTNHTDTSVQMNFVDSILALADQYHVKVLMVTTPQWKPFHAQVPAYIKNNLTEALMTKSQQYGVPWMDLRQHPLPDNHFSDSRHLNAKGATYISPLINRRLEEL